MADAKSQAVKLVAEEIVRAINKRIDKNNQNYVVPQIANQTIGGGGGGGFSGTIPASSVIGLGSAIGGYIEFLPEKAESGDVEAGRVISTLNGLAEIVVSTATIETAQIQNLYGSYAEFINLVSQQIKADQGDFKELKASFADIQSATIGSADIDYAQIKDLAAESAIIRKGIGGELYIDRLAVTEANMVSLTVGQLMLRDDDGNFAKLVVNEDGSIGSTPVTFDGNQVIIDGTMSGSKIIESSITADKLNVSQIFASDIMAGAIKAANIDVATLFVNQTFASKISSKDFGNSLNISENSSITLARGLLSLLVENEDTSTGVVITDGLIRAIGDKFSIIANDIDLSANSSIIARINNNLYRGSTAPSTPAPNSVWMDISGDEPVWKKYVGGAWVVIDDISDLTAGLDNVASSIIDVEFRMKDGINANASRITSVETETGELDSRLDEAELAIQPENITATVLAQTKIEGDAKTEFVSQVSGFAVTKSGFNTFVGEQLQDNTTHLSQINQTASKIDLVVNGEDQQGKLQLTEAALNAIFEFINLTASDINLSANNSVVTAVTGSQAFSQLSAKADRIDLVVKSATSTGSVTLTDEALEAIAQNVNLDANESVSLVVGERIKDIRFGGRNYIKNSLSLTDVVAIDVPEDSGIYGVGRYGYARFM